MDICYSFFIFGVYHCNLQSIAHMPHLEDPLAKEKCFCIILRAILIQTPFQPYLKIYLYGRFRILISCRILLHRCLLVIMMHHALAKMNTFPLFVPGPEPCLCSVIFKILPNPATICIWRLVISEEGGSMAKKKKHEKHYLLFDQF